MLSGASVALVSTLLKTAAALDMRFNGELRSCGHVRDPTPPPTLGASVSLVCCGDACSGMLHGGGHVKMAAGISQYSRGSFVKTRQESSRQQPQARGGMAWPPPHHFPHVQRLASILAAPILWKQYQI